MEHLFSANLSEFRDECAMFSEFKYLLRENSPIDQIIKELLPLNSFGAESEKLIIKGSKDLIDSFYKIDAVKWDVPEKLENIEYIGLSHSDEIVLHFKNDKYSASGVYDFTYEFLDELFSMGKYANYCIKSDYQDLLKENIVNLLIKNKEKEKQFRLIKKNNENFIRGFTSLFYNNYDNNVAIYLSLLSLNKFAQLNNISYKVKEAHLTDSAIRVVIENEKPIIVKDLGKVYLGVIVLNNEIRDSAFTFELRYRIVDNTNPELFFSTILKDSVFNIKHTTGPDIVRDKVDNVLNLKKIEQSMFEFVKGIKNAQSLSDSVLQFLYEEITNSKLKKETKNSIRDLYDRNLINNTLKLIEAFHKIDMLVSDYDEKVYLERIYNRVMRKISDESR